MPVNSKSNNEVLLLKGKPDSSMKEKIIFKFINLLLPFLLAVTIVSGQGLPPENYTDIDKIMNSRYIEKTASTVYINNNEAPEDKFESLVFTPGIIHQNAVPNEYVTKKLLLKFNICNSGDSAASVYFCPGFYFKNIRLYLVENTRLKRMADILPPIPDSIGFRKITLEAHDSATVVAELTFVKTYNNHVIPRLINSTQIPAFIAELQANFRKSDLVTFVFCGLLLMMILFSFSSFLQGANPEFLYYSIYTFLIASMLFLQSMMRFRDTPFSFFLEGYFDFILQGTGIIFYMIFMRRFLSTKEKYPFLYYLYSVSIVLLIVSLLLYSYLHQFTDNYTLEYLVENSTKIFLLLLIIVFLVYSSRHWENILLRYLFWGNFFLFLFALISQLGILFYTSFKKLPGILSSSLFYYELGLFLELVFFIAGLNHKNRRQLIEQTKEREMLKARNQLQEYEKEIAVYKAQQEERVRISADMHDELGAGMTAIRLMSEIARNKMKENTPVEINKISQSANDVLNKMNAIIWSMNSGNDTLDNLISYIRSYAHEYFEGTSVQCKVNTPDTIPEKELSGDKRRNLFLAVKESLNNVLKHADATQVIIDITAGESLSIKITDNGKGIDLANLRVFGNGLKNIKRRLETIGGHFTIEANGGTISRFEIPLT